jgi:translocator protein
MHSEVFKSVRFYLPLISGYFMTWLCPMINAGNNIKARPPAFVFGIVWPILYLLLGYSWVMLENYKYTDIIFGINILLGVLWIYNYSCISNKKNALYILLSMILGGVYLLLYSFENEPQISYFIAPYTVWLIFALMLNFKEVNMN